MATRASISWLTFCALLVATPARGQEQEHVGPPTTARATWPAETPCDRLIAQSVSAARVGLTDAAERGLVAASTLCRRWARAHFALGGGRFTQKRYGEVEAIAAHALGLAPPSQMTWELLATSRYLQGDLPGALEAWNQISRPRAGTITVAGVARMDHAAAIRLVPIEPRSLVTPHAFRRADRRVRELPSLKDAQVIYQPREDGTADLRIVARERSVFPDSWMAWGAVGVNAAFRRELRIPIAGPFGRGELWDLRYRWKENRPRLRLTLDAPAPGPFPGIVTVEALWEQQSYRPVPDPLRQQRRRVGVSLSDWWTGHLQWMVGAAADDFDSRRYSTVHGHVDTRWFDDRVTASVAAGFWMPMGEDDPFATSDVQAAWRTTTDPLRPAFVAQGGVYAVYSAAPLAVWPIAGSGESRGPLLRGHELHHHGIVVSDMFGERLAFGSAEYRQPLYTRKEAAVALAGFVDISRAWRHPFTRDSVPTQIDIGAGLRLIAPGGEDQLRVDFGYGLRDGATQLSAGYILPWGR